MKQIKTCFICNRKPTKTNRLSYISIIIDNKALMGNVCKDCYSIYKVIGAASKLVKINSN